MLNLTKEVEFWGALEDLLYAHHRLLEFIVAVHKLKAAVILVKEGAQALPFLLNCGCLA